MSAVESNTSFTDLDERFMRRALALAAKGRGRVEPNPMVGCVLVKDEKIIAEGYHRKFGGPHAEIDALRRAGDAARGATAYVTLEPCCHYGKTGPCTDALLAAGVARVIAAMPDPFPEVAGKGLDRLRQAGVVVQVGLLEEYARRLNAPYLKRLAFGIPWVILKWAQSLDGKLASASGHSQWITAEPARRQAHVIRGYVDAVLVGAGTVLADDPQLTCRMARPKRIAQRIVVDGRLSISVDSQLVRTARQVPVVIACTEQAVQGHGEKVTALQGKGCQILPLPQTTPGRVDLKALLAWCGARKMTNIMVEGGGNLLGGFLDAHLADELAVFIAPMLIGGGEPVQPILASGAGAVAPSAVTPWPGGVQDLANSPCLKDVHLRRLGPDILVQGHIVWP